MSNGSKSKNIAVIGLVIGLVTALLGLLVLFGAFGGEEHLPSSASYGYDSGYAEFGADFYTYVSNNAQEAAGGARASAYNLIEIIKLLKAVGGVFLTSFGLMGSCYFGLHICSEAKPAAPAEAVPEAEKPEAEAQKLQLPEEMTASAESPEDNSPAPEASEPVSVEASDNNT